MNEWEFELLEEKAPAESVTVSGVEVKKGGARPAASPRRRRYLRSRVSRTNRGHRIHRAGL